MLLLFLFRFNSVWNLYSFAFVCSSYLHYLDFSRVEVQKNCLLSCLLPCKDASQVVKVVQVTYKLIVLPVFVVDFYMVSVHTDLFQFDSSNILIASTLLSVITTVQTRMTSLFLSLQLEVQLVISTFVGLSFCQPLHYQ